MKTFATALLIVGLMLATTPHLLCPMACATAEHSDHAPKCSHCGGEKSDPQQAPQDDCDSPCCDQVDAVPATSQAVDLDRAQMDFLTINLEMVDQSVVTVAADEITRLSFAAFSSRLGCALHVLFEHLLL